MPSRRELLQYAFFLPAAPGVLARTYTQEAAQNQPKWLQSIADQLKAEFNLPAIWVATYAEGSVEAAVAGVRKAGDTARAALNDKLTIASISKTMAGLWIATLVDKGTLSYATKVLDVLPELIPICLPEHEDITLGQLLTHTAGVIRDVSDVPNTLRLEQYPAERLRQARHTLSTPAPPGSKGKEVYSNNGVTLAAAMAEKAVGEAYEIAAGRFYRERLGLQSWDVWPMNLPDDLSLPWPHDMKNGKPVPQPPRSVQYHFVEASGGAVCTIADLARFGLLATVPSESATPLLKRATWQTLLEHGTTPRTTLCSFGAVGYNPAFFSHGGTLGTTQSFLCVLPEWKIAAAFHSNSTCDGFRGRATQLLLDALCVQRARLHPPPPCRIVLIKAAAVDSEWQNEIVPKRSDDKVRIRVDFTITAPKRTGYVQTLVKVGVVEQRNDRLSGLLPGRYSQHFEFEPPKTKETPVMVRVDSLETSGNRTPEAAHFDWILALQ